MSDLAPETITHLRELGHALDEVSRLCAELTICERTSQWNANAGMDADASENEQQWRWALNATHVEIVELRDRLERATALADRWSIPNVGIGPCFFKIRRDKAAEELRAAIAPTKQHGWV